MLEQQFTVLIRAEQAMDEDRVKPALADRNYTAVLAQRLFSRAQRLVDELGMLRQRIRDKNGVHHMQGLGHIERMVRKEAARLQAYHEALALPSSKPYSESSFAAHEEAEIDARLRQSLQLSNLPSFEFKWSVVKRCRALVAMNAAFFYARPFAQAKASRALRKDLCSKVMVDAVVDDGLEWVRVVGDTMQRIEFQMAESGWDFEGEAFGYDSDAGQEADDDDDDDDDQAEPIFVLKTARSMRRAALCNRYNYRVPKLRLVLPRVYEGQSKHIDHLIYKLRSLGGSRVQLFVDCADSALLASGSLPPLETALQNLTEHGGGSPLGETLNLDCSVLLAMTSDITHGRVEVQSWHTAQLARQIERERTSPGFLLRMLNETIGPRRLICHRDTAEHFLTIVGTLGTESEKERAQLLIRDTFWHEWLTGNSRDATRQLATHRALLDWSLPVQVCGDTRSWGHAEVAAAVSQGELPDVAEVVAKELKQPNLSAVMFGWVADLTTLSCNGELEKKIRRRVEENRMGKQDSGPRLALLQGSGALFGTPHEK